MTKPAISVITPALNEEKNILFAIDNILSAFKEYNLNGEIVVINDGSRDSTPQLVEKKIKEKSGLIKMINHDRPKGIGASFWEGADMAEGEVVVMIPGDNENDPQEILRYYDLTKKFDLVVPFIVNKEVRPFFRRIISSFYKFLINASFSTNFEYTNGTTLYRKTALQKLKHRGRGFFYQADILIRLNKKGCSFAEVPCRLKSRKGGSSKAITFRALTEFIREYLRLVRDFYFKKI